MGVDRSRSVNMATEARDCARELGAQPFLIEALVLRAQALNYAGDKTAAAADLTEALSLAAAAKICGPFEKARGLAPLLRAVVKQWRSNYADVRLLAFADSLFTRMARTSPSVGSSSDGPQFSRRELEVLEELIQGRSNKEIARALDMTEHTAKYHLKNLFAKLQVERRTQAIAKARELGLG